MTDFFAILGRLTDWQNLVDFLLVAFIFYALLRLLRGTQAVQLVVGFLVIGALIFVITRTVELTAFSWLLRSGSLVIFVAIPVIFQPEIRRVLEQVGRRTPFFLSRTNGGTEPVINEIVRACEQLSARRHGTLLVLEGSGGLDGVYRQGSRHWRRPFRRAAADHLLSRHGAARRRGDRKGWQGRGCLLHPAADKPQYSGSPAGHTPPGGHWHHRIDRCDQCGRIGRDRRNLNRVWGPDRWPAGTPTSCAAD